jgi:hypothetical protein
VTGPTADDERLADDLVGPLLLGLRDCLADELVHTLSGRVVRAYVPWDSGTPVMDGCDCRSTNGQGDAWARFVRMDPQRSTLGSTGVGDPAGCPPTWVAVIELGVARCHPVPSSAAPLDPQLITDTALLRLSDGRALRRVARCCRALDRFPTSVGSIVPLPPQGGCSGVVLTIQVEIAKTDKCRGER